MKGYKKYLFWAILAGIAYVLLNYHFIFFGKEVKLLKKSRMTLDYTFYSTTNKTPEQILKEDDLREDGIGILLIEMGLIDEDSLNKIISKYEQEEY